MNKKNFKFGLSAALIIVVLFSLFTVSFAQEPAPDLDSLHVSIWPDFDEPSVLVLLTGKLAADVPLPATVTIPIPGDADLNAVAQVEEQGMASLDFEESEGTITFTTPNPRFRVEYYAPYDQDGLGRSYDFDWESDLSITDFALEIQQPANATSLNSTPEAVDIYTNQVDGLVYHVLASQGLAANVPYNVSLDYEMASEGLTVGSVTQEVQPPAQAVPAPVSSENESNNWLLLAGVIGLVVLAMVGTWIVATRSSGRKSKRPIKPSPKKNTPANAVIYCHNCGQPSEGDDRFCRRCGTELKKT